MTYNYQGLQTDRSRKLFLIAAAVTVGASLALTAILKPASAESSAINFEPTAYSLGNINGQDGWKKTGAFDAAVDTSFGFTGFGTQSLRISNAVTSGSFGDQTFAKPLVDGVGETGATWGSFTPGNVKTRFETQFDVATTQSTQQPGLALSVSPDRGDGSRMTYLRFEDDLNGVDVHFMDVTGTTSPVSFNDYLVADDLSRTTPHTIKITLDVVDGPSNDVVKVYVDNVLVKTGTSWENYYRYDTEASAEQSVRGVKTVLFRTAGTAVPANAGKGFLFDNLTLSSSTPVAMPQKATTKQECMNGNWVNFQAHYKNQGQCVASVVANDNASFKRQ